MKILWGSPLPPIRSGVSDYAVELLSELGKRAIVRVLVPPGWQGTQEWQLDEKIKLVSSSTTAENDEIVLVHLGNNPYHLWLTQRLGKPQTVVVLHDLVLHHLLVEETISAGDKAAYERRLVLIYGAAGQALVEARDIGLIGTRDPFLYPARRAYLEGAQAIIVHSAWAEAMIKNEFPDCEVCRIPLSVADPGVFNRTELRTQLGIGQKETVLMHLGFLSPEKGLIEIIGGLGAAIRSGIPATLLLVGEGIGLESIKSAAESAGIGDRVRSTGWVDSESLLRMPAAADLGVVFRTPSAGETSAATLRFLACGTPVAVGGLRQFLELPENVAPRITPGPSAPAEIARILSHASKKGPEWDERRIAARSVFEAEYQPAHAADKIINFLESLNWG